MPNIDPDSFPPWSSSSSESSFSQTYLMWMCWWLRTACTSKTIQSRRCDTSSSRRSKPYYRDLTDASFMLHRQQLAGTNPVKWPEKAPSGACLESKAKSEAVELKMTKPDSIPLMRTVNLSSPQVDMEDTEYFKWARKYQPKALEDFICHRKNAEILSNMVRSGNIDHFIFEGPPGVGKRTMIMAFLRAYYGVGVLETKVEAKKFIVEAGGIHSSFNIFVRVRVSSHHIEINVSELGEHVMHVMMQLMKENYNILSNQKNGQFQHRNHRAIVLHKAEKLSKDAQLCIQSLMESYGIHNKVIFSCSIISKLFKHLGPICTVVQLLPPSNSEIVEVLHFISNQVAIELPHQVAQRIAENSNYSLRQAIRSFEATWQLKYPFKENQSIITGWEGEIASIAEDMIKEQSLKQLYGIRGKLLLLMEYNVSPKFVFDTLLEELKKHLTEDIQSATSSLSKQYYIGEIIAESSNNGDDQPLRRYLDKEPKRFHDPVTARSFMMMEEFIAKFMSVYKFLDREKKRTAELCCA